MLWIPLSDREMATIVAALLHWMRSPIMERFTIPMPEAMGREVPLSQEEIDALCQKLEARHATIKQRRVH